MPAWHRHPNQSVQWRELMAATIIYRNVFMILFINYFWKKPQFWAFVPYVGRHNSWRTAVTKIKWIQIIFLGLSFPIYLELKRGSSAEICRNIQLFPSWVHLPPLNMNVAGLPGRESQLWTHVWDDSKPEVMSQRSSALINYRSLAKIINSYSSLY